MLVHPELKNWVRFAYIMLGRYPLYRSRERDGPRGVEMLVGGGQRGGLPLAGGRGVTPATATADLLPHPLPRAGVGKRRGRVLVLENYISCGNILMRLFLVNGYRTKVQHVYILPS
jgi:hypothetical protein